MPPCQFSILRSKGANLKYCLRSLWALLGLLPLGLAPDQT